MRWRVELTRLARRMLWVGLVLAVAAYGSVVVRNVTESLRGMASHSDSMVVAQQPNR